MHYDLKFVVRLCVVALLLGFSVGVGAFVIGLSQFSSFFSCIDSCTNKASIPTAKSISRATGRRCRPDFIRLPSGWTGTRLQLSGSGTVPHGSRQNRGKN